jgi:hypothetical protein
VGTNFLLTFIDKKKQSQEYALADQDMNTCRRRPSMLVEAEKSVGMKAKQAKKPT